MYNIYKQNDRTQPYVTNYVADSIEDLEKINIKDIYPGSTCIVTSTSDVYMLTASKQWAKL